MDDDESAIDRRISRVAHVFGSLVFGTPPQAQVKLDPGIDLAATQGAPGAFRARNYAERGGRSTVLGTYCDDKRTDSDGRCLKRNRLQVGTVNPQQCHIGGRITSDELRRHRVSA